MNAPFAQSRCARLLAAFLVFLMELGPLATPYAHAAPTGLADEPLGARTKAPSNIMLTVDDSTSMLDDFLPDFVISGWCRDAAGKMSAACGDRGAKADLTSLGRGRYLSPGYIMSEWGVPYSRYVTDPNVYDASGLGAGCGLIGGQFMCAAGVDPTLGNSVPVGLERFPASSKRSGQLIEYAAMWGAPVHNAAFNKIYYNPALTYDPPVDATGVSWPQMDDGHTSAWTK